MQGGQVWALRDDLNLTSGPNYSSHPYVLLQYTAADGRPSMTAFQVLREKDNVKFDYALAAGTILQAPMPMPLLDKPLGAREIGEPARSLNIEVRARLVGSATVTEAGGFSQVTLATDARHFFQQMTQATKDWNQIQMTTPEFDAARRKLDSMVTGASSHA